MFEGIETEKLVVGHFHVCPDLRIALKARKSGVEFVFEDVSHGDEFGTAFLDGESVFGSASAASAAADQGDFDLAAALSVNSRKSNAGES
jgi:hypothetical protein